MKTTYNTYYFYKILWPRIEKDDIIAIIVTGTALNKPTFPYIIYAMSTWTLIGCPGCNFGFWKLMYLPLWLNL